MPDPVSAAWWWFHTRQTLEKGRQIKPTGASKLTVNEQNSECTPPCCPDTLHTGFNTFEHSSTAIEIEKSHY